MRRIIILLIWISFCSCKTSIQSTTMLSEIEKVVLNVDMHCESCQRKIEKNISWEKGIKELHVDLNNKQVIIKYNPKKTTSHLLKSSIEKLGYNCVIADK